MDVMLKGIPAKALLYNTTVEDAYEVLIYLTDDWIRRPLQCRKPGSNVLLLVERDYHDWLGYIHNPTIKKLLLDRMIIKTRSQILLYQKELNRLSLHASAPEEEILVASDSWFPLLSPTKLELLESHVLEAQRRLNRYEALQLLTSPPQPQVLHSQSLR